jgi:hypothetical protein
MRQGDFIMAHRSGKKKPKPKASPEPVSQVNPGLTNNNKKKPPAGKPVQPPMNKKPNIPRTTNK